MDYNEDAFSAAAKLRPEKPPPPPPKSPTYKPKRREPGTSRWQPPVQWDLPAPLQKPAERQPPARPPPPAPVQPPAQASASPTGKDTSMYRLKKPAIHLAPAREAIKASPRPAPYREIITTSLGSSSLASTGLASPSAASDGPTTGNSINSMSRLDPLPDIAPADRPSTFDHAFSVNVELQLMRPRHLYHLRHWSNPGLISQHSTIAYISPSHTHVQIRDQIVLLASMIFGLDLLERTRWRYELQAKSDAVRDSAHQPDFDFVLSASRQGGWTWTLKLIEVERNAGGGWSSLRSGWRSKAGDGSADEATAHKPRGV